MYIYILFRSVGTRQAAKRGTASLPVKIAQIWVILVYIDPLRGPGAVRAEPAKGACRGGGRGNVRGPGREMGSPSARRAGGFGGCQTTAKLLLKAYVFLICRSSDSWAPDPLREVEVLKVGAPGGDRFEPSVRHRRAAVLRRGCWMLGPGIRQFQIA